MKFVVVNSCPSTIRCFRSAFVEVSKALPRHIGLECFQGSLADYVHSLHCPENQNTAVVSPANSLCFMGGGFDRGIAELLGERGSGYRAVEAAIQNHVLSRHHGFVPPQASSVVDLQEALGGGHASGSKITHLVLSPTMAVPERISYTTVFYCMWNTLLAMDGPFDTVVLPAIGAGYGGVPAAVAAATISGALGLFYMRMGSPLNRGAAVLLFLRKDYRALGIPADIARIESVVAHKEEAISGAKNHGPAEHEGPLEWRELSRILDSLG
ncbi:macro domain-like protein [Metschnikowia bicuspidata var. bicuspidata NRRL YB-4993]|uniref:Macro domain-like protein n=1 Tax=Metschnikowia bicuspidata var. bicuspidata NRRL YB-4993 TaxID=869754 RepID=A0A1A0HCA5_9ASCO|nr:macro domain-like protein [Metschnikowia bicuspidata var. bicuspidata NRRL YB-4993]OBA21507.1 macro domain-like protein [Metschnikowia bicuspidata var. bicuspidata NRRL YB-4993]